MEINSSYGMSSGDVMHSKVLTRTAKPSIKVPEKPVSNKLMNVRKFNKLNTRF